MLHILENTRQVSSVIHSARPTVSMASSDHCFLLFCFARFEKWWDGQHVRKIMITTGRDCGLAEWIKITDLFVFCQIFTFQDDSLWVFLQFMGKFILNACVKQ